jgi:hypothetical protein
MFTSEPKELLIKSYTGKHPNLCNGVLTVTLGNEEFQIKEHIHVDCYDDWAFYDDDIACKKFPENLVPFKENILKLMTDELEKPHCGGCR